MTTTSEIPVTPGTPQRFSVTLSGVEYRLLLRFNQYLEAWQLTIANAAGTKLVEAVTLTTGEDVLSQHRHLGIGGQLFVVGTGHPDTPPTFTDLGDTAHLLYVTG